MSKSKDMQVALLAPTTSHVLTMPDAQFAECYVQPIEDDTWIRHAEIVHMDQLVETDAAAVQAKADVMRAHMTDHTRAQRRDGKRATATTTDAAEADDAITTTTSARPDAVLEGILWQESFMQDYRVRARAHDAEVATQYRSSLVEQFRQHRPSRPPTVPFGEEEDDDDEVTTEAAAVTTQKTAVADTEAVVEVAHSNGHGHDEDVTRQRDAVPQDEAHATADAAAAAVADEL